MISCAVCARRLVVYGTVLSRWRQEFGQQPEVKAESEMTSGELAAELKRLRRENEVLRQERDILKKAINIMGPERL